MRVLGVVEVALCLLGALALHAGLFALLSLPDDRPAETGVELAPAAPELAALVAAWDSAPETATPDAPPAPQAASAPARPGPEPLTPVRTPVPRLASEPASPNAPAAPAPAPRARPTPFTTGIQPMAPPAVTSAAGLAGRAALAKGPNPSRTPAPPLSTLSAEALPLLDPRPAAPAPPRVAPPLPGFAAPPSGAAPAAPIQQGAPSLPPLVSAAPEAQPPDANPVADATLPVPPPRRADPAEPARVIARDAPPDPLPDQSFGPPTARAVTVSLRPVARQPARRPAPFVPRPVARPESLGTR